VMTGVARLHELAAEYYGWLFEEHPVLGSEVGRHDGDGRLCDTSPDAVRRRREHIADFRRRHGEIPATGWGAEDFADHELFAAALERAEFADQVLRRESRDPQLYVEECLNGVFSLLKKEYAPKPVRMRAATARLDAMPGLLAQARENLTEAVRLYADLAAEGVDGAEPLFTTSLELLAEGSPETAIRGMHLARDGALSALRDFAAHLRDRRERMRHDFAMGPAAFSRWLARVLLIPLAPGQVVALLEAQVAHL